MQSKDCVLKKPLNAYDSVTLKSVHDSTANMCCKIFDLSVLFSSRAPLPESVFMEMSPKTESSCNTMDC